MPDNAHNAALDWWHTLVRVLLFPAIVLGDAVRGPHRYAAERYRGWLPTWRRDALSIPLATSPSPGGAAEASDDDAVLALLARAQPAAAADLLAELRDAGRTTVIERIERSLAADAADPVLSKAPARWVAAAIERDRALLRQR